MSPVEMQTEAAKRARPSLHGDALGTKDVDHRVADRPAVPLDVRDGRLLTVIGDDPDVVGAASRAPGRGDNPIHDIIDVPQRTPGDPRAGSSPVGALVVTDEVDVHHRQPAGHVQDGEERDQLAHDDRDREM
jgi:hypothetical protein